MEDTGVSSSLFMNLCRVSISVEALRFLEVHPTREWANAVSERTRAQITRMAGLGTALLRRASSLLFRASRVPLHLPLKGEGVDGDSLAGAVSRLSR